MFVIIITIILLGQNIDDLFEELTDELFCGFFKRVHWFGKMLDQTKTRETIRHILARLALVMILVV